MRSRLRFTPVFFFAFQLAAQEYDYSYHTGGDSALSEITLIEERADGGWVAAGENVVCGITGNGILSWSKMVETGNLKSLRLDDDENIYYLKQIKDPFEHVHSYLTKLDPNGNFLWQKKLGSGALQVEANNFCIEGSDYLYVVGRMRNDTSWFSFACKFQFTGALDWIRRFWHHEDPYSAFTKISQAPGGMLYLLGQRANKTVVFQLSPAAVLSGLNQYSLADSLTPVDIIAHGDNNIQVLMNHYEYTDHFPKRRLVKMQLDDDLVITHCREYYLGQHLYHGFDLETHNDFCFLAANKTGNNKSSVIIRTDMKGDDPLTRDIYDMNDDQRAFDFDVRPSGAGILAYEFGPDSVHILSALDNYLKSNCDSHYGSIHIDTLLVDVSLAVGLTFSITSILISNGPFTSTPQDELLEINYCFGFASIQSNDQEIKIYPQPATDQVILSSVKEVKSVTLYDIFGRQIVESADSQIAVSDLSPGVYIAIITFRDGSSVTRKITKQ